MKYKDEAKKRTRQERVATDTWRSLGCRTTPLEHWSKRKSTVERWFPAARYHLVLHHQDPPSWPYLRSPKTHLFIIGIHIYGHVRHILPTDSFSRNNCGSRQWSQVSVVFKLRSKMTNLTFFFFFWSSFHREPANKNQKWDPLRAMKTFIRRKIGHTT